MKILFYYNIPRVDCTLLTYTLVQELILLGHTVDYGKPSLDRVPVGHYDWVHAPGKDGWEALEFARKIQAKIHIHDEGAPPYRVGLESAVEWGYDEEPPREKIEYWRKHYMDYLSAMYEADSCSLNGKLEFDIIEALFDGKKLANAHKLCCGVDARYALTLPDYPKDNYMVTVSRLEPNKQVFKIAEALALMDTERLPPWVIVGYGSEEQVGKLVSIVQKNKIKTRLHPCFGAQKWMWVKRAKIMLQGYSGIPPAEGLLCDVPVLAFKHPFMEELFDDALFWAWNNDVQDFARLLSEMLTGGVSSHFLAYGKNRLLNNELYAQTQEQLARQYEAIFQGRGEDTLYDGK